MNDQVELFPVGKKLAFDALRQRLWVICTKCGRWNLSPLDERGAAIEACEKRYHDTVLRKSSGEIGLARLPSGLELVRIGRPMFPEYADWRYGERFRRRRWITYGTTAVGIGALVGVVWGLPAALSALGVGSFSTTWVYNAWGFWQRRREERRVVGSYYTSFDRPAQPLRGAHLEQLTIEAELPVGWRLEIPTLRKHPAFAQTHVRFSRSLPWVHLENEPPEMVPIAAGDESRLLTSIISQVNRGGGHSATVRSALEVYDQERGDLFNRVGQLVYEKGKKRRMRVGSLPAPLRLALEIQLAEKRDTAWLDGELASLSAAWKEAEEIAAIADTLTGGEWMDAELAEARQQRLGTPREGGAGPGS